MDCRKQEDGIYDDETPWNIIDLYFNKQYLERLVRHQIESYNYFINTQMTNTIDMFNPVVIRSEQYYDKDVKKYSLEINISFENLSILRPQIHENNGATKLMFPNESRLRNFTYASSTLIDIKIKYIIRSGDNLENEKVLYNTIPKVHIGKIPIMLQSSLCLLHNYKHINNNVTGECKYDPGGYFIINGSEKTVLGQERAAENKIQIFNISKNNSKWEFIAEIKSIPSFKCISPKQIAMYISDKTNDYTIYLSIPRVKKPLPLFVIFRALNIISDKDICKKIVLDIDNIANKKILYHLSGSIVDGYDVKTYDDAIKYITNNVMFTPINMDKDSGQQKKKRICDRSYRK